MTPYLFFFFVSIAALAYGTYTDFKERLVSNWVTYGMVLLGLAGYALWAIIAADAMIFGVSLAVTATTFALSYALYKAGVWAGGDVKVFTGLAALNSANPAILARLGIISIPFLQPISLPIFPLSLFVFSLFAMLPYGAALSAARLMKNSLQKEKFKQDLKTRAVQALELAAAVVGLSPLLAMANITQFAVLPLLFAIALIPKKPRLVLAVVLLFLGLWFNGQLAAQEFVGLLGMFLGIYLLFKLYALSKVLMRKPVKIAELQAGMISAQTIVQNGKRVKIVPEAGIKKLIKYFALNKSGKAMQLLQPKGKVIVSSRAAGGLTEKQIRELKRLAREKKIPEELMLKESAPFVPAVLIAYVALNIVGDVIWLWVF